MDTDRLADRVRASRRMRLVPSFQLSMTRSRSVQSRGRTVARSSQLCEHIRDELTRMGNAGVAEGQARYLRGLHPFLGIPTPQRRVVVHNLAKNEAAAEPLDVETIFETGRRLFAMPEREFHHAAIDILSLYQSTWIDSPRPLETLDTFAEFIETKSWWDTVDTLASLVGALHRAHASATRPVLQSWIYLPSERLWMRRVSIIHQLRSKSVTDEELLFEACRSCASDPDFFIRKAIGWALREYRKTDRRAVDQFLEDHEDRLSPLSRREARLVRNAGAS